MAPCKRRATSSSESDHSEIDQRKKFWAGFKVKGDDSSIATGVGSVPSSRLGETSSSSETMPKADDRRSGEEQREVPPEKAEQAAGADDEDAGRVRATGPC